MSVTVKVKRKKNPQKPGDKGKFYGISTSKGNIDIFGMARKISKRSTVSETDVIAVIMAFIELIPEELLDGYIIELGDLGHLRLTVHGDGVENKEDYSTNLIDRVSVRFLPSKRIKTQLKTATFTKSA